MIELIILLVAGGLVYHMALAVGGLFWSMRRVLLVLVLVGLAAQFLGVKG